MHAFVFGKGCAVKVVDIPDLAASLRSVEYECVQLPLMNFTGRVEHSELLAGKKYRVRITMLGSTIAVADLESDGVFHAQITDYSSDRGGAVLFFYADPTGANLGGARLEPINSAPSQHAGLRAMPDYGGEVLFRALGN